jgi:hypothetical protein
MPKWLRGLFLFTPKELLMKTKTCLLILFGLPLILGCGCESSPVRGKIENASRVVMHEANDYTVMWVNGGKLDSMRFRNAKKCDIILDVKGDGGIWVEYKGTKKGTDYEFEFVGIHVRDMSDIGTGGVQVKSGRTTKVNEDATVADDAKAKEGTKTEK